MRSPKPIKGFLTDVDKLLLKVDVTANPDLAATMDSLRESVSTLSKTADDLQADRDKIASEKGQLLAQLTDAGTEHTRLLQENTTAKITLDESQKALEDSRKEIVNLRTEGEKFTKQVSLLQDQLGQEKSRSADAIAGQIAAQRQLADLIVERDTLRHQLETQGVSKAVPISSIMDGFRRVVADMNVQKVAGTDGQLSSIKIDDLQVEIKGGLDLKDGVHFVPVNGESLTPDSVSTVRFTVRPDAAIRVVDDQEN